METMRLYHRLWQPGILLALAPLLLLVVACSASAENSPANSPANSIEDSSPQGTGTIVWGKVDLEPTDAIAAWQPMADYLAANLGDYGISSGVVKVAPDMKAMGRMVAAGEVDLITDSFYPAMSVADYSGAVPLAVRLRGKPDKHAVFFTQAGSDLNSLDDLSGQTIALAERHSTSGFMLPVAHLKQVGANPIERVSDDMAIEADQVGYIFAGDDDVAVLWVLNGSIIAGAVDNETFEEFNELNPGMLKVLAETQSVSREGMVLVRKDVDPKRQEAIKLILQNMNQTEDGTAILKSTKTVSFGAVHAETEAAWNEARQLYDLIKD